MFSVCLFTGGPPQLGGGAPGVPPNPGGRAPPSPQLGGCAPGGTPPTGGGAPRGTPPNWGGGTPGGTPQKNLDKNVGQNLGQKMDKVLDNKMYKILDKKLDKHFGNFWSWGGGRGRYASCGHAGGLSCFILFLLSKTIESLGGLQYTISNAFGNTTNSLESEYVVKIQLFSACCLIGFIIAFNLKVSTAHILHPFSHMRPKHYGFNETPTSANSSIEFNWL